MWLTLGWPLSTAAVEFDGSEPSIPTVLTPARLRQPLADVPASVTVITADMLERFGIRSIPEAMRLVPGMEVSHVMGPDFRINYHGTNLLMPRRMNVLIDGLSVYRPALARVDWNEFPVVLEDIDRIEVTRSPDSAAYGANSMLAVVNILTKHPSQVEGWTVLGAGGTERTARIALRYGGKIGDATTVRVTVDEQRDGGFDQSSRLSTDHDSFRVRRMNIRTLSEIDLHQTLDLQAAWVQSAKQVEFIDKFQQSFPDIASNEYDVKALWQHRMAADHEWQFQAYATRHQNRQAWTTCPPTATLLPEMFNLWQSNPAYANLVLAGRMPSGGSPADDALATAAIAAIRSLGTRAAQPTCVRADQDFVEQRLDVEAQDTVQVSDALRWVSGIGARQDAGDSQTFFGGTVSNTSWRAFANLEYKPNAALNVNAGGFWERDQLTGSAFSPRIAVNLHLSPHQTVRLVQSRGTRMPDLYEQRARWRYWATDFSVPLNGATAGYFFQSAKAPGNLTAERITSTELGYFANMPRYGLLLDAKWFDDRLTDLLSEKLQVSEFVPTNRNSARLRGAELQLTLEPNDRWTMLLAAGFLRNTASSSLEQTQISRQSGALGISYRFDHGWRLSTAWYGASGDGVGQNAFGAQDWTLSKTFVWNRDRRLTLSATVRHLDHAATQYYVDVGKTAASRYQSNFQTYLSCKLTY